MDDDKAAANTEIRYITIELMKIASRRKKPFGQLAYEFVSNTYTLEKMIKKRIDAGAGAKASRHPLRKNDRI